MNVKIRRFSGWVVAAAALCGVPETAGAGTVAVTDAMRGPALRDVRLKGYPSRKMNAFFRQRILSDVAQHEIFGEARRAFELRDDDIKGHGGLWRGEFWGKLMLGTARVADYLNDRDLTRFVDMECRRMIALQDKDGYLGSYKDKELVSITDPQATLDTYHWYPVWNIWNRKYAIWAMLAAYKTTGDRAILVSVEAQANQLIDMLHRRKLRLHDTGTLTMHGLPSMSILKPMVLLYEETGNRKYLDFAAEMLPDWDREDGECPNFFRNAKLKKPLREWYPEPEKWAKSYEFMSCVDGLIEYYRATGDRRCLETAAAIRDNLAETEANPIGGVGYGDMFKGGAVRANALNEVCDVIHWIRLNLDLFLVTGDEKHLDSIEPAYFNMFLAGINRDGAWGPFFVRGHGRHEQQRQCGYAYNHCCVNNLPRTWMDVASAVVTADRAGAYHVNFYQDAQATVDGVTFEISGNYPVGNRVTVKTSKRVKTLFHKPAWCPRMDVSETNGVYTLVFDMNPRLVNRTIPADPENAPNDKCWPYKRYRNHWVPQISRDVMSTYRTEPAATVMWGPLVLARAQRIGLPREQVMDPATVNNLGYGVKLTPRRPNGTWGLWDVELAKPGAKTIRTKACDFQGAGDDPYGESADAFSIWF